MLQFVLKENVLTDNVLLIPEKGQIFKGGYIAIIQEYVFANAWSDKLAKIKKFRSVNSLNKYLSIVYPNFEADFFGTALD